MNVVMGMAENEEIKFLESNYSHVVPDYACALDLAWPDIACQIEP